MPANQLSIQFSPMNCQNKYSNIYQMHMIGTGYITISKVPALMEFIGGDVNIKLRNYMSNNLEGSFPYII